MNVILFGLVLVLFVAFAIYAVVAVVRLLLDAATKGDLLECLALALLLSLSAALFALF